MGLTANCLRICGASTRGDPEPERFPRFSAAHARSSRSLRGCGCLRSRFGADKDTRHLGKHLTDGVADRSDQAARSLFPFVERIFADAGYQGPKIDQGRRQHRLLDPADRQTQRHASLCRSAQAMDRRAHLRLDQPQPPSGTRLRALRPNRRRFRPPGHDPHHAQATDQAKPLLMNPIFLDRL